MIYLTMHDAPSGIYVSQAIDVVKLLNRHLGQEVKLVAFLSVRNFFSGKKWIQSYLPEAIVLPAAPKLKFLLLNRFLLNIVKRFLSTKQIIARGPFACALALRTRQKGERICYDGRGAVYFEGKEYGVYKDNIDLEDVFDFEKKSVNETDYRIAVSPYLIDYWQETFDYKNAGEEVVIPCTLGNSFEGESQAGQEANRTKILEELGWEQDSIILVYSGSMSGWQSIGSLQETLTHFLSQDARVKLLFLSKESPYIDSLSEQFPDRVARKWLAPHQVKTYLSVATYGIMIRNQSKTNRVAAPTKFAEYLAVGLKVLISPNLGAYSDFVVKHDCGIELSPDNYKNVKLTPSTEEEREQIIQLSQTYFSKLAPTNLEKYTLLIQKLNPS